MSRIQKMNTQRQKKTLLERTLNLLNNDERSLSQIATRTELPYFWLRKLKAGKIPNPSVNRIEKLYETLSNSQIFAQ